MQRVPAHQTRFHLQDTAISLTVEQENSLFLRDNPPPPFAWLWAISLELWAIGVPAFHHSNIPLFHYSTIPVFLTFLSATPRHCAWSPSLWLRAIRCLRHRPMPYSASRVPKVLRLLPWIVYLPILFCRNPNGNESQYNKTLPTTLYLSSFNNNKIRLISPQQSTVTRPNQAQPLLF